MHFNNSDRKMLVQMNKKTGVANKNSEIGHLAVKQIAAYRYLSLFFVSLLSWSHLLQYCLISTNLDR